MSISSNSFVVNSEDFSKQTIGLPWFSFEFGGDQLLLLKASQLSPQAVRLEGVVPLPFFIQPGDDPPGVVLDLQFLTSPDSLVPIQNLAFGRDLDGDLDSSVGDVPLEGIELLWGEIREDLIGRSVVAVDLAHGKPSSVEPDAVSAVSLTLVRVVGHRSLKRQWRRDRCSPDDPSTSSVQVQLE